MNNARWYRRLSTGSVVFRVGIGLASAAALASGLNSDRANGYIEHVTSLIALREAPGLPIFATVSAATSAVAVPESGAMGDTSKVRQVR
jgi:hypothetical protein